MAVTHFPIDDTHDPAHLSWVDSANGVTPFPVQNLPYGIYRMGTGEPRPGVAIGDAILDLRAARDAGLLEGAPEAHAALDQPVLNALMALSLDAQHRLRFWLSRVLRKDTPEGRTAPERATIVPMDTVQMLLPARIGDYTDFYASVFHATNVGSMFRPDNPLLPNYKYVPIGYHGRASSIVPSGSGIVRPSGQTRDDASAPPLFGPSRRLDYELEVGFFIGRGNEMGSQIAIGDAGGHLFGVCLLNDWSARDVQTWEYQPLGPFLAKNFASSISPWVITMEAMAPFTTAAFARPSGDPAPLPHLRDDADQQGGAVAIELEVQLASERMRREGVAPVVLSRSTTADLYWTPAQLVAHHASNGCNLVPGDLLGSGTVSGPGKDSRGCLLELTWRGTEPVTLPTGEQRRFLEDGDEVIMRGRCARQGFRPIGLGECRGIVLAS